MQFVIFHGSFGSPEGNWFPELKEKLEAFGQKVIVPQFPTETWEEITKAGPNVAPKYQSLENWLAVFAKVYRDLKSGEPLCFIGHSLGPVFILHVVDRFNIQLDSAIFVSPFFVSPFTESLNLAKFWQFDHVNNSFYKKRF